MNARKFPPCKSRNLKRARWRRQMCLSPATGVFLAWSAQQLFIKPNKKEENLLLIIFHHQKFSRTTVYLTHLPRINFSAMTVRTTRNILFLFLQFNDSFFFLLWLFSLTITFITELFLCHFWHCLKIDFSCVLQNWKRLHWLVVGRNAFKQTQIEIFPIRLWVDTI